MRNLFSLRILLIVLVTIVFCPFLLANGNIRPSIDVAQFKDTNNSAYLEIYYSVPEPGISYKQDDSGSYSCQLVMDLEIRLDDKLWTNKLWKIEKSIPDTLNMDKNSQMVDVLRYFIEKSGNYAIKMRIKDMYHTNKIDSAQVVYEVKSFTDSNVEISDVQIATEIVKANTEDMGSSLVKNNYKIAPNPAGVYGSSSPNIFYYFEAYNLQNQFGSGKYKSVARLINSVGEEMEGLGLNYRTKSQKYDTGIEIGMLNVSKVPSGKYSFVYGIADDSKTMLASKQKLIYIFNPDVQVANLYQSDELWPLDGLTEKELDEEFEKLQYLYDKPEKDFYASLKTIDAKKSYIIDIWKKPNPDNLPPIAFREQYLGRAEYSNNQFKSIFGKGWKSDRGRTFILYGIPSNVERFPQTETSVPYQIWTYDKLRNQAGVQFVFADIQGFNKYEIVHSDLRGERYNPDWRTYISRGSNERQFR